MSGNTLTKMMDKPSIVHAAGNLHLADVIATALDALRPHSAAQARQVARMQRELVAIRQAEFRICETIKKKAGL